MRSFIFEHNEWLEKHIGFNTQKKMKQQMVLRSTSGS